MKSFVVIINGNGILVEQEKFVVSVTKNGVNEIIYECKDAEDTEHTYNTLRDAFYMVKDRP